MTIRNQLRKDLEQISPALYRYFCASFTETHADDLVQETLVRLIDKIDVNKVDLARGNLRMYAFGVAHFVRLEALRMIQTKSHEPLSENRESASPSQDEKLEQNAKIAKLRKAVSELSELQQEIIAFYLDEELTYEAMAEILKIPVGTIKSHIHRAKEILREKLK